MKAGRRLPRSRKNDVGDETGDASAPRSDENVVSEIGAEAGVPYGEGEPLGTQEKVAARDAQRWELDPASAEDYEERLRVERRPEDEDGDPDVIEARELATDQPDETTEV